MSGARTVHGAGGVWRMPRGILGASVLSGLATTAGIALTALSGWLVVAASHRPQILTLMAAIVGVRAFGMARPAFRYWERLRSHDAALRDLTERRVEVWEALVPLTPGRLGRRAKAEVLTGAVEDLEDAVYAEVRVVVPVLGAALAGLLTVATAALFSSVAALVVTGSLAGTALVAWWTLAAERRTQTDWLTARADVARVAALVTSQALELQAVGATPAALDRLDAAQARLATANGRRARLRATGMLLTGLTCAAATAVMAVHVHGLVADGLPDAVGALLLLTPVATADALAPLPDAMGAWARSAGSSRRLDALVAQPPAVTGHGTVRAPASGATAVRDVTTRWSPDRPPVGPLTGAFPPGSRTLVTGPNGCGKSTLLAVLATWLDPETGHVLVDGADARPMAVESLRARVAVLDDEPHVFATTLRENLRFAKPDAGDDELVDALGRAGLAGWPAELPDGLDTMLGAGGRGVSGGERARLGLARALVSGRGTLLLDEPLAHLDSATAAGILTDLATAAGDRTIVMVSHRDDLVTGAAPAPSSASGPVVVPVGSLSRRAGPEPG